MDLVDLTNQEDLFILQAPIFELVCSPTHPSAQESQGLYFDRKSWNFGSECLEFA